MRGAKWPFRGPEALNDGGPPRQSVTPAEGHIPYPPTKGHADRESVSGRGRPKANKNWDISTVKRLILPCITG